MQQFLIPTTIYMGHGALAALEEIEEKSIFIVTDSFLSKSGVVDQLIPHLCGKEITVFDQVVPDPPIKTVVAGASMMSESKASVMIALGGGSSLDTAKAIRTVITAAQGEAGAPLKLYAIPTTSGSGSEVTGVAVITDTEKGVKYPLTDSSFTPTAAILDPVLVQSVPAAVTADTGMDVLTHAMEAYVAKNANDFTDALCEKAISLVFRYLPDAWANGNDLQAREKMHNASCMAGVAFNIAGLGMAHGLAHALGGKFHIPHGRLNAILLPAILRSNGGVVSDDDRPESLCAAKKYQMLAQKLGLAAATPKIGVMNLARAVEQLNIKLHIPQTLSQAGIALEPLLPEKDEIIRHAQEDAVVAASPIVWSKEDIRKVLALVQ